MKDKQYYYSESEWNRLGCGPIPPERDLALLNQQENDYLVFPEQQGEEDRPSYSYSRV